MIISKGDGFSVRCANCGYESKIIAPDMTTLREKTRKYKWVETTHFDICSDCASFPHEMKKKIRKEFEQLRQRPVFEVK